MHFLTIFDTKTLYRNTKLDFLVNTGMYLLKPEILSLVPIDTFYDITELIETAIKQGMKVGLFPIEEGDWIDIGQWNEYKNAVSRL